MRKNEELKANLLCYTSARIKRVVRSTFAAESMAAADGLDATLYLNGFISWTFYGTWESIQSVMVTDCCSLVQHLNNLSPQTIEKRISMDTFAFREALEKNEVHRIVWCQTTHMLADCLTKFMKADNL